MPNNTHTHSCFLSSSISIHTDSPSLRPWQKIEELVLSGLHHLILSLSSTPTSSDEPFVKLGWMGPRCQGETISTAVIMFFLLLSSVTVPPCACFRHLELSLSKMPYKFLSHLAQKEILLTLGTYVISKTFVKIKIWCCCCVVCFPTWLWRSHVENHFPDSHKTGAACKGFPSLKH